MEMYKRLKPFTGPNMLPQENMTFIANKIRPHMAYCRLILFPKLEPWCKYIREMDRKKKLGLTSNGCKLNMSALAVEEAPAVKSPCYDDFFCGTEMTSKLLHVGLVMCLVLLLLGVIGHIITLPATFRISRRKTGFGYYLPAIALCDLVYISLGAALFIYTGFPTSQEAQIDRYASLSVYMVPYAIPIMELSFLFLTWLFVFTLIDRYWFHTDKKYTATQSANNYLRNIAIMFFIFSMYTAPKFANYTTITGPTNRTQTVFFFGSFSIYRLLILNWLRMVVELVIPCVLLGTFLTLVRTHSIIDEPIVSGEMTTTALQNKKRELNITSLTIWTCGLLFSVLIMRTICHMTVLSIDTMPEIIYLFTVAQFALCLLFFAIRPLIYLFSSSYTRKYITNGWVFVNTPPPQAFNDVQYMKYERESGSHESDSIMAAA